MNLFAAYNACWWSTSWSVECTYSTAFISIGNILPLCFGTFQLTSATQRIHPLQKLMAVPPTPNTRILGVRKENREVLRLSNMKEPAVNRSLKHREPECTARHGRRSTHGFQRTMVSNFTAPYARQQTWRILLLHQLEPVSLYKLLWLSW